MGGKCSVLIAVFGLYVRVRASVAVGRSYKEDLGPRCLIPRQARPRAQTLRLRFDARSGNSSVGRWNWNTKTPKVPLERKRPQDGEI